MKSINFKWLYLILVFFILAQKAPAQERLALVIGNAAYQDDRDLKNPVNDAKDLAAVLRQLGFKVTHKQNLNLKNMKKAIIQFGEELRQSTGVGLFYFSGHGVQHNGANYLMPIGAMRFLSTAEHLPYETVNAGYVLATMKAAQNELNIVILDACRNNPFKSLFKGEMISPDGLLAPQTPSGFLIAYATAAGKVAKDGKGRNSPYVMHLIREMQNPNVLIEQMLKQVRVAVKKETNGMQEPAYYAAIDQDFSFKPGGRIPCSECSQLLRVCERHFQANRLTTGEGGTALACYKQVLEKDPSNVEALAGLDKIEARYVMWTERALSQNKLNKAKQYLESLRKVKPESPKLAALEQIVYPKPPTPEPVTPSLLPSFFETIGEISSGLMQSIVSVWQFILVAVIVIALIWLGWQKNWLGEVIAWGRASVPEQKQARLLSALNPLDYFRLLWWVLVMPQQLIAYRKKFGEKDEMRVGKWLASTLMWLPLLMPSLALGLEWLPHSDKAWLPETYLWISAGLVGCWLLARWLFFEEIMFGVAFGVAFDVAFGVVGVAVDVAVGVTVGVTLIMAFIVAFIVALVVGKVVDKVAVGVVFVVPLVAGYVAGYVAVGVAFLVTFLVTFFVAGIVKESLKTGTPSWLARLAFLLLIAAHLFLIYYCFLGGWRLFV